MKKTVKPIEIAPVIGKTTNTVLIAGEQPPTPSVSLIITEDGDLMISEDGDQLILD